MPDYVPAGGLVPLVSAASVLAVDSAASQFSLTTSATVGNTLTETTLVGAGVGAITLPANTLIAGRSIAVHAWGTIGDTLTPSLQIRNKLGAVTALDSTAITLSPITGTTLWEMSFVLTCRTSGAGGTGLAQGAFTYFTAAGVRAGFQMVNTATFAMDTTAALLINSTAQWGTADPLNTMTCTNFRALRLG